MDAPAVRRRTAWLPLLAGIALLAVALVWWMGRTYAAGVLLALTPVAVGIWVASRGRMTAARWVIVALLVLVVAPVLVFFNVAAGCMMTSGFGGPACWWDSIRG